MLKSIGGRRKIRTKLGVLLVFIILQMLWLPRSKVATGEASISEGLYAGVTNPGGVYRYTGTNWDLISPQLGWSVTSLVGYSGYLYAGGITDHRIVQSAGRVWRYNGELWEEVSPVGGLGNQVCFLIVFKGDLYAGTTLYQSFTDGIARLYRLDDADACAWTMVIDDIPGWYGFRSAYVWNDWLYLGDWMFDLFARWDGNTVENVANLGGSCVYAFEEYDNSLYSGGYLGALHKVAPSVDTIWPWIIDNWHVRFFWSLKSFGGYLYIGTDRNGTNQAKLYRYDGVTPSPEYVWAYSTTSSNVHEGIISMATDGLNLYLGVGGQAMGGPDFTMPADGTGEVFSSFDGVNFESISGTLGTGVQTLYYYSPTAPPPAISATIDVDPDTLNLKSNGQWISVYIELPEGYNVTNIDVNSIKLTVDGGNFWVDSAASTAIGDYDGDGISDLMVKFDRTAIRNHLIEIDLETEDGPFYETYVYITGAVDAAEFSGLDTIRVRVP